jgi:hypothetical protein
MDDHKELDRSFFSRNDCMQPMPVAVAIFCFFLLRVQS